MAKRSIQSYSRTSGSGPGLDNRGKTDLGQPPRRVNCDQNWPSHIHLTRNFSITHSSHAEKRSSHTPAIRFQGKSNYFAIGSLIAGVFLWNEIALKERQLLHYASAAALFLYLPDCPGAVRRLPSFCSESPIQKQNERNDEI